MRAYTRKKRRRHEQIKEALMAVKSNNVRNARKSRSWTEQDDAALGVLLKRKIRDTTIALRECESPYERSRLKQQKERYRSMLRKVENGSYNGDIIYHELRAAAALSQEAAVAGSVGSTIRGGKKYSNAYGNVDFDYEAAFRKKRYYGAFLPILMTVLSLIMIVAFIAGPLIPSVVPMNTESLDNVINLNALFVYKLGEIDGQTIDVGVTANDNDEWIWPEANYGEIKPEQGSPYTDAKGNVHDGEGEVVYLYKDLGCTEVYIDAVDVVKAWFRTKMLEKTRLDFIEDLEIFQGRSIYYEMFLAGEKAEALIIQPMEDGSYDFAVIFNHIGVYGTIIFLLLTFILMIVIFIQNIIRIFTYTSRRIHVTTILCFISSLLTAICPALAICEGTDIGGAIASYLMKFTNAAGFAESTALVGMSLVILIPVVISFVLMILPFFFKNRIKNLPSRIPKGNKVRV